MALTEGLKLKITESIAQTDMKMPTSGWAPYLPWEDTVFHLSFLP